MLSIDMDDLLEEVAIAKQHLITLKKTVEACQAPEMRKMLLDKYNKARQEYIEKFSHLVQPKEENVEQLVKDLGF